MGVYDELIYHGARHEDILVTDSGLQKDYTSGTAYPIYKGRADLEGDVFKTRMSQGISEDTTVEEFAKGAHGIINLGNPKTLTHNLEWTRNLTHELADKPFFAVATNPNPGILPDDLYNFRDDAFYMSGNQRFENTANNFAVFGYMGLGALMAGARTINKEMTVAAAWAIHKVAKQGAPEWIRDMY